MKKIAKELYRQLEQAVLTRADGTQIPCRGLVARQKAPDHAGALPHEAGCLCQPLYVFTGGLEEASPGDRLEQGGAAYTVLNVEPLALGSLSLGLRLVMERRLDDAGS
ncbi:hypothetical protein [Acutalibacter sp.]|uniref:hypothetical protein n=1 Tax=Acutalibacter sp. TaxID=1918636 RepID=UPI00216EEA9C|nr:hypothetical protein [Acutalibacter sp.]